MNLLNNHLNFIKINQNELTNNLTANRVPVPKELINTINKLVTTGIENKEILLNKELIEKSWKLLYNLISRQELI